MCSSDLSRKSDESASVVARTALWKASFVTRPLHTIIEATDGEHDTELIKYMSKFSNVGHSKSFELHNDQNQEQRSIPKWEKTQYWCGKDHFSWKELTDTGTNFLWWWFTRGQSPLKFASTVSSCRQGGTKRSHCVHKVNALIRSAVHVMADEWNNSLKQSASSWADSYVACSPMLPSFHASSSSATFWLLWITLSSSCEETDTLISPGKLPDSFGPLSGTMPLTWLHIINDYQEFLI